MIDEKKLLKPESAVIVHGPNSKPADPPIGMIHLNESTGYRERWDGQEWVPLRKTQNVGN